MLSEKFDWHHPLNGQSERYACEGIDLNLSTLASGGRLRRGVASAARVD
jgi:hypothetical protein